MSLRGVVFAVVRAATHVAAIDVADIATPRPPRVP